MSAASRLLRGELRALESRRLLAWCLERGADEFSVEVLALRDEPGPRADAFEELLAPWERGTGIRPAVDDPEAPARVRLWSFTPLSAALLQEFLPGGVLGIADVGAPGWLENPVVYRRGALLLAADTHAGRALLFADARERRELAALGIELREEG